MDTEEVQSIIRDYHKQLYANKMDNLEKMENFLERYNLQILDQEEIKNINKPIKSNEIETVIKNLPPNKVQDGFTGEFYLIFREALTPILSKSSKKIAEEGTLPNSFYEATITLIPKPDKDTTKKRKLQTNITDEYRCKYPQQNTSKKNPTTH